MKKIASAILLLVAISFSSMAQDGWQNLFNGKDFSGWKQLNGKAKYRIEGNEIVGESVLNTPNSFMCTEKDYSDFILEVEVYDDPRLNSGIQFRSESKADYKNGRVHGYQAEIDPAPRAYSGGIYGEGKRGWLYTLSENPKGRKAFVNGTWNKYRIEAIGHNLRIWINGVMTSNLVDDVTPSGFIALQVHGIGNNKDRAGSEVRWRNIRIKTTDLENERWPVDPQVREINRIPNTLTENEIRKGWRLLWDGKTSEGWRRDRSEEFPTKGWEMKDGVLTVLADERGGSIMTKEAFSEFELIVDFNITEGANSGIKYFIDPAKVETSGGLGLEFQILDDEKHPDAKKGVAGNRTVGSLYDLIRADNLSIPGRKKEFRGVGNWNRARIVVKGNHVEHWLNDAKVVEYERGSQIFKALINYSKYSKHENFGLAPAGHILLQDHGDTVHFRNIKIREL